MRKVREIMKRKAVNIAIIIASYIVIGSMVCAEM